MRHIISLGIRGVLLEVGGVLLRLHGGIAYRWLLRRRRLQDRKLPVVSRPAA